MRGPSLRGDGGGLPMVGTGQVDRCPLCVWASGPSWQLRGLALPLGPQHPCRDPAASVQGWAVGFPQVLSASALTQRPLLGTAGPQQGSALGLATRQGQAHGPPATG